MYFEKGCGLRVKGLRVLSNRSLLFLFKVKKNLNKNNGTQINQITPIKGEKRDEDEMCDATEVQSKILAGQQKK